MPPDDQDIRSAVRCTTHPGNASVAVCHVCGRPLCLTCAVPVRGEVFGSECLATVLGPEWAGPARSVPSTPRDVPFELAGAAFAAVLVSTVFPWTRFGEASGLFGAWGIWPFQWSLLGAGAGAIGMILWLALRVRGPRAGPAGALALLVLAGAAVGGAVLHMYNPPPFTHAWLGPWVGLGSAAVATGTCAWLLARAVLASRRSTA